jgi:iron complex transport system substrate-binding protein
MPFFKEYTAFGGGNTVLSKKSSRLALVLAGLMAMSVGLAACGSKESDKEETKGSAQPTATAQAASPSPDATKGPATERVLKDGLGHEVKVPANPQHIIASYLEDHLVALGVKPAAQWSVPNGVQDYLKDSLAGVPNIPYDLPYEAVTSFNPDLMIVGESSAVAGDKYAQYSKIVPTYVLGDDINKDWRKALLTIGEVLDKKDKAQKAIDDYEKLAKDSKDKLQKAVGTKTAAAIWLVQKQFYVVSEKLSSGSVVYQDLGFGVPDAVKEISAAGTGNWNPISMEKLASMNADYIFLVNSDKSTGSEALKDPVWSGIPAVKNGQVYEFDATGSWLYSGAVANTKIINDVVKSIVK